MGTLKFTTNKFDAGIIRKIAARAVDLYGQYGVKIDRKSTEMDVSATHASGNPLRLEALLEADDFNFMHDITGIYRHLNRETGQLEGFFSPRFSAPQSKAA